MNVQSAFWMASAVFLLSGCLAGCAGTAENRAPIGPAAAMTSMPSAMTDNALVVVVKDPRSARQRSGLSGPGYNARLSYHEDPALHRYASKIAEDHSLDILSEWPLKSLGVHCFVVNRPDSNGRAILEGDERVLWVQPFNEFELKTSSGEGRFNSTRLRESFQADFMASGRNVRVAVVDTGVDSSHPDLRNASLMVRNFSGQRGHPSSELHGTAVVGLIAAKPASDNGVRGIAIDAKTHLLRGCWQDSTSKGRCNTLTLALALDAAIELNPDIINLSLSGGQDRILDELIKRLTKNGTLVIAAYDEKREPQNRFPTPRAGVVYAFGLDPSVTRIPNGSDILVAPKHAVSLSPMAGYDLISGHSIAAPQLTAMAAVLMETYATDQRDQTVSRLGLWLERQIP